MLQANVISPMLQANVGTGFSLNGRPKLGFAAIRRVLIAL